MIRIDGRKKGRKVGKVKLLLNPYNQLQIWIGSDHKS